MGRHARARHERAALLLVLEQPGTTQVVGEEVLDIAGKDGLVAPPVRAVLGKLEGTVQRATPDVDLGVDASRDELVGVLEVGTHAGLALGHVDEGGRQAHTVLDRRTVGEGLGLDLILGNTLEPGFGTGGNVLGR